MAILLLLVTLSSCNASDIVVPRPKNILEHYAPIFFAALKEQPTFTHSNGRFTRGRSLALPVPYLPLMQGHLRGMLATRNNNLNGAVRRYGQECFMAYTPPLSLRKLEKKFCSMAQIIERSWKPMARTSVGPYATSICKNAFDIRNEEVVQQYIILQKDIPHESDDALHLTHIRPLHAAIEYLKQRQNLDTQEFLGMGEYYSPFADKLFLYGKHLYMNDLLRLFPNIMPDYNDFDMAAI